jgi:hypothetical protein
MAAPFTADHSSRIFEILLGCTADQGFQVVEVHAGAERLTGSGQDQHANGGVSHFLQSADQILDEFVTDGIAFVGAVEGDGRGAGVESEMERFVDHA